MLPLARKNCCMCGGIKRINNWIFPFCICFSAGQKSQIKCWRWKMYFRYMALFFWKKYKTCLNSLKVNMRLHLHLMCHWWTLLVVKETMSTETEMIPLTSHIILTSLLQYQILFAVHFLLLFLIWAAGDGKWDGLM